MNLFEQLPKYQSHKVVAALKITEIYEVRDPEGALDLECEGPKGEPSELIRVPLEYVEKHNPQVGGYFVVYQDGYQSWSPAKAFEEGYKIIDPVVIEEVSGTLMQECVTIGKGAICDRENQIVIRAGATEIKADETGFYYNGVRVLQVSESGLELG